MTGRQLEQALALFPPGPKATAVAQRLAMRHSDKTPAQTSERPEANNDYTITDEDRLGQGGLQEKFKDNIQAIRVLHQIAAEGRKAVDAERRILARYVGWGGLKGVFDPANPAWTKQHAELKTLLTNAEWAAASRSQLDAFYTSRTVTQAIHAALGRLGFEHGRIIDPAVGIGNFFGTMPESVRLNSQLHGVELDILTSQVVEALYPSAKIAKATGFQQYKHPADHFDLAIGNPPFGNQAVSDTDGTPYSGWSIHNYFFGKSIDLVRPGGLMAMVVSHSFLDKLDLHARLWISRRAELVSAVRLPETAFKTNANTEVVTDVLIFRKLDYRSLLGRQETPEWVETTDVEYQKPDADEPVRVAVNNYFLRNPDRILGRPCAEGSSYRANEYTVKPTGDLAQQLWGWVASLPQGIYTPIERTAADLERQAVELPEFAKEGSFFLQGKEVWQRLPDLHGEHRAARWTAPNEKGAERMSGMIRLRDTLRRQMKLERSDASDNAIESGRAALNHLYDDFKSRHGFVNDPTNRRIFLDDTESSLLQALEFDYEKAITPAYASEHGLEPRAARATKADIFKHRVLYPPGEVEVVHTAKDALLHCLNHKGRVDMAYMQQAYGREPRAILDELDSLIFHDPVEGLVTADKYLSGDVKTKLNEARRALEEDPAQQRNVEALAQVIPEDKVPSEIHAALGAAWIPTRHFSDFARVVSGGTVNYTYVQATAQWLASSSSGEHYAKNHSEYGIPDMGALDLLLTMMNSRPVAVRRMKIVDGKETYVIDEEKTESARAASDKIRSLWESWLWADMSRAEELATLYNEKFNRTVERHYDGSHLTFPGMSPHITLLAHQKNAVWRGLQDRTLLLDQTVGAGKTFEMVALVMEMRRLGIAKKPMLAVPNHLTLQWRSEFHRLYPGANILAATPADFEQSNRERFFSKVVTGDWDAVIVGHSSLKKIPLPKGAEAAVLNEQIKDIGSAVEDMKRGRGDRHIVRDMERIKANLESKLVKLQELAGAKDQVVDMADLGVDSLVCDEHHEFKNLMYTTQMTKVSGLGNPAGSGKAFDLFVKIRWLKSTFGQDAPLITATGTPVSNSLAEMFTMQRYMQYEHLKRQGLHVFDAWAKQYGDVQNVYEVAPSGTGYRMSQRFAKFKNLGSLMADYRSFADVVTLDDLKAQEIARGKVFPVPKLAGGRPINVVVRRSALQERFFGVPELDRNHSGAIRFEVDLRLPTTIIQDESNQYVMVQQDGAARRMDHRRFETREEAAHALVARALTPMMKIDPESIIGQFERLATLTRDTKGKINALSLTSLANKAGLDYRLIDPSAPDDPQSKVNEAVRRLLAIGKNWEKDRGVQLIFCDMSVPLSARARMASKEKRIYIRQPSGALAHKKGTLHTAKGHEALPYYLVADGKAKSRTYLMYDALTGQLMKEGLDSKQEAHKFVADLLARPDGEQTWLDQRARSRPIGADEIDEYRNEHSLDVDGDSADVEITLQDVEGVTGIEGFSIYDDMKAKLIAGGVPAHEIEFIHDHDSPQAKHQLFKRVNAGLVRFLLGSTPKMGAGTNVQERIVGLHNVDAPFRPSDLEQREGRAIRRGNQLYERDPEGFELEIYRYATEQTYDTRRWQILEHKAAGIEQLRNYTGINEMEDVISEASNSADMKAAASGNPLILQETQLSNEVKRLRLLERAHTDTQYSLQSKRRAAQRFADEYGPQQLKEIRRLCDQRDNATTLGVFGLKSLNDKEAVMDAVDELSALLRTTPDERTITYRGLAFSFKADLATHQVTLTLPNGIERTLESVTRNGVLTRMENFCQSIEQHIAATEQQIASARQEAFELSGKVGQPFDQLNELQAAIATHGKIQRALRKSTSLAAVKPEEMRIFNQAVHHQKQRLCELGFEAAVAELEREEGAAQVAVMPAQPQTGLVDSGDFCGRVVSTTDNVVVQRSGRHDQLVHHDPARLSRTPQPGEVVSIRYTEGQGSVTERPALIELQ